jgi:predicted esterase
VSDIFEWLTQVRKLTIHNLFGIGYSEGTSKSLSLAALPKRPSASAILAPAGNSFPAAWAEGPIYMAVGRQDAGKIVQVTRSLSLIWKSRQNVQFEEIDPCGHFSIVAESIKNAYAFFEAHSVPAPSPLGKPKERTLPIQQ